MILEQFATVSESEVGFERLYSFIIGLAIRGKITPQQPTDGDASDLLEPGCQIEVPFEIPASWAWCRLSQIADSLRYGYTAKADPSIADVKFLRITDIQNNQVNWSTVPGCIIDEGKSLEKIQLQENDIVIARTGGTVGKSFILDSVPITPAVFASYLIRVRLREPRITKYLKRVLESDFYWSQLSQKTSGTGQPNVNAKALNQLLIPVPPLPEQKRIVAKVEELTDLCNRLEKAHQTRNKLRDDFTASALDNLTQAQTPAQLKPAWTIIKNNFPTITATPDSIPKLRQTILQLSMQGKMVPASQGSSGSALLDIILETKTRLLKEKKLNKDKKLSSAAPQGHPWPVPDHWAWARLQDLFEVSRGGSPRPAGDPRYFGGDIPWITVAELTKDSQPHLWETTGGLTPEGADRSRPVAAGDLLITNSGATLGVPKITQIDGCINDGVARLRLFHDGVNKEYAYWYLTQQTRGFRAVNQGMGQPNLNTSILAAWFIPLPPLREQKLIVTRVNDLMAICDRLEEALKVKNEKAAAFAQSVIAQELAGETSDSRELVEA